MAPPSATLPGAGGWVGTGFFVQVEYCAGVAGACSVRMDEEKYATYASSVKEGVEAFFNKSIEVVVLGVPTLYALEVRVMPEQCHPSQAARLARHPDAETAKGHTIFSKVVTRKWPKVQNVLKQLQEFCRIPTRFQVLSDELLGAEGEDKGDKVTAVNGAFAASPPKGSKPAPATLENVCVCIRHDPSGQEMELHTDAAGYVQAVLFPGTFLFSPAASSSFDRLDPDVVIVPPRFKPVEVKLVAGMRKQCTFLVVDHLQRVFPQFPLRLQPHLPASKATVLRTKANGQAKGRFGRGLHTVSYVKEHGAVGGPLVHPLNMELEVMPILTPQFFKIVVHRIRFACEFVLRTSFDEAAQACPFKVRSPDGVLEAEGITTANGVAACDLAIGQHLFQLLPASESPFHPVDFTVEVSEDGSFLPTAHSVATKTAQVQLTLVTPDGEPAAGCEVKVLPQFPSGGSSSSCDHFCSDAGGLITATITLLEPHTFRTVTSGRASEYMPQEFTFLTGSRQLTAVVARSVLGEISENSVAILIDASGSMQVYIRDIKDAVNLALVNQFHKTSKRFSILAFTDRIQEFRPNYSSGSDQNIEAAMRFTESIEVGGRSNALAGLKHAFQLRGLEAIYMLSDGKCDVNEEFLAQVRYAFFAHPTRPKIYPVGINCVPGRSIAKSLHALASLTHGTFRPICLEQDFSDPLDVAGSRGVDLSAPNFAAASTDEETQEEAEGSP